MTHLLTRLLMKVDVRSTGCWLWSGSVDRCGYGRIKVGGKTQSAHRVMYLNVVGEIPAGLHLDHLCRVRSCVNPSHLEPVTPQINTLRGVSPAAVNSRRMVCSKGHALDGANLAVRENGERRCRTCHAARERRRRQAYAPQPARRWTDAELEVLRSDLTAPQVAELLGRTLRSVCRKRERLTARPTLADLVAFYCPPGP